MIARQGVQKIGKSTKVTGRARVTFHFKTGSFARSGAPPCSSGSRAGLVLSTAVLVPDLILQYGLRSLDQASEHRHDPFQFQSSTMIRMIVNRSR